MKIEGYEFVFFFQDKNTSCIQIIPNKKDPIKLFQVNYLINLLNFNIFSYLFKNF